MMKYREEKTFRIGNFLKKKSGKAMIAFAAVMSLVIPYAGYSANRMVSVDAATNEVVSKAESRIGSRYVYGACHSYAQLKNRNQRAFDCSGLVNWSYYQAGSSIGINTSSSLRRRGRTVSYRNLRSGDIVLFPGHAGVYIGHGKMVHAPNHRSRVKVSSINGYWKRRFRCGRRIISASYLRERNRKNLTRTGNTNDRYDRNRKYRKHKKYVAGTYKTYLPMNVRKKPTTHSAVCGGIRSGRRFKIIGITKKKWGMIRYKGKIRYVSLKYSTRV